MAEAAPTDDSPQRLEQESKLEEFTYGLDSVNADLSLSFAALKAKLPQAAASTVDPLFEALTAAVSEAVAELQTFLRDIQLGHPLEFVVPMPEFPSLSSWDPVHAAESAAVGAQSWRANWGLLSAPLRSFIGDFAHRRNKYDTQQTVSAAFSKVVKAGDEFIDKLEAVSS